MQHIAVAWLALAASALVAAADDDAPLELKPLHRFPGIDVVETINQASHEHGGPPAKIHDATINFELRDARAHTVAVKKLEMITSECDQPAKKRAKSSTKSLAIQSYELYTWDDAKPIAKGTASIRLTGGPRRLSVNLDFDGVETYSGCAFAIDLVVDRVRKQIELPLSIKRFEPLRRAP